MVSCILQHVHFTRVKPTPFDLNSLLEVITDGLCFPQAVPTKTLYPAGIMAVAVFLMLAGTLPIPVVFLMRRFRCVKLDADIHQASIKRIDTTASTTGMVREAEVRDGISAVQECFRTFMVIVTVFVLCFELINSRIYFHLTYCFKIFSMRCNVKRATTFRLYSSGLFPWTISKTQL